MCSVSEGSYIYPVTLLASYKTVKEILEDLIKIYGLMEW